MGRDSPIIGGPEVTLAGGAVRWSVNGMRKKDPNIFEVSTSWMFYDG